VTERGRLEAFSDGVFAVAITLLVLDLRDPGGEAGGGDLAHRLLHLWPNYAGYAVSFLVIGIVWVNHHDLFRRLRGVDRRLQFLNLILLGFVALIPFPTAVLAEHLRSTHDSHAAAVAYSVVMTAVGLAFVAIWAYLARTPELLDDQHDQAYARARMRSTLAVGPPLYATAGVVGLFSAPVALVLYAVVALWFALGRSSPEPAREDKAIPD
jgi:uncharacterized membrane protein